MIIVIASSIASRVSTSIKQYLDQDIVIIENITAVSMLNNVLDTAFLPKQENISYFYNHGVPDIRRYIHKKYELHLHNMGVLWKDIRREMWKTVYQFIHKAVLIGSKQNIRHVSYMFNRTNKTGLHNLKVKSLCN